MILTVTLPPSTFIVGISAARRSRYRGSHALSFSGRSTHSCIPTFGLPSEFCRGISECIIPRPAVMNCRSPASSVPALPAKSSWSKPPLSRYVMVSCPRWGWSGKPASDAEEKWSSMRKGEKFRSLGVPIERRTRAPAPSDCSIARKAWRMARGTLMFVGLLGAKKVGGMSGSPKYEDGELDDGLGEGSFREAGAGKRKGASGACWMRVVN